MANSKKLQDLLERLREALRSEARFREMVETHVDPMCRILTDGTITYANRAFCAVAGLTAGELLGANILAPAPGVQLLERLPCFGPGSPSAIIENTTEFPDAPSKWIQWHCSAFALDGSVMEIQIVGRDIGAQKSAEEASRLAEARYRRLAGNIAEMVYRCDEAETGSLTFINEAAEALTGYGPEDFYADPELGLKIIDPDDREKIRSVMVSDLANWDTPLQFRVRRKDGLQAWIELKMIAVLDKSGRVSGIEGIARDISSKKDSGLMPGDGFQLGPHGYRLIAEASPDYIYILDRADRVLYVNSAVAKLFHLTPAEMRGAAWKEFLSAETYECQRAVMEKVFSTGEPARFESGSALGGDDSWEDTRLVPLLSGGEGAVQAVLGITRDITDRKDLEDIFRTAGENFQMGIYIRQEGRIVYANSFMTKYLGYSREELGARSMLEFIHPDYRQKFRENNRKMLRGEIASPYEYRVTTKSGHVRWLLESVVPFFYQGRAAVLGNVNDITRQREVEQLLIRVVRGRGENILLINDDFIGGDIVREILEAFGYSVLFAADVDKALDLYREAAAGIDAVVINRIKSGARDLVQSIRRINPDARIVLSSDIVNGGGVAPGPTQSNIEFLAARIRIALDVGKKN